MNLTWNVIYLEEAEQELRFLPDEEVGPCSMSQRNLAPGGYFWASLIPVRYGALPDYVSCDPELVEARGGPSTGAVVTPSPSRRLDPRQSKIAEGLSVRHGTPS